MQPLTKDLVSVVVPVYLGSLMLDDLCEEIHRVVRGGSFALEIILVDDGSPDQSWSVIRNLCLRYPFVKGLKLSRNFGQQIAVSAGIACAQGKYVVTMDCDFENPPSAIPILLKELNGGSDVVYAVANERTKLIDRITSWMFWLILTKVLGLQLVRNQLMMRGMSARFVEHYRNYPEAVRTVAGISADIGFTQSSIRVEAGKRQSGTGSQGFLSRFSLAIDMVLSFSTRPLTIAILVSLLTLMVTLVLSVFYTISFFVRQVDPGFTTLVLLQIGLGSVIVLLLAVAGTYLANIYKEVRRRPLFIIDERLNFD